MNFEHCRHNKDEEQTVGIDLSNSCSFSNLHDKWQMAIQSEYEKEADTQEEQKQLGFMGIHFIWPSKDGTYHGLVWSVCLSVCPDFVGRIETKL
jgi:hypothetical protein